MGIRFTTVRLSDRRSTVYQLFVLVVVLAFSGCNQTRESEPTKNEVFRVVLDTPGGELPFQLELNFSDPQNVVGWVVNYPERIEVPAVTWDSEHKALELRFDYYDSTIEFENFDREQMSAGKWRKRVAGDDEWQEMTARITPVADYFENIEPATKPSKRKISGRYQVKFSSEPELAVAIFDQEDNGVVTGTFLTTTGDYRYLAGLVVDDSMTLSCFDGAHALLFRAKNDVAGRWVGDFWSGKTFHDRWVAEKNEVVRLSDPLGLTKWRGHVKLTDLKFKGLDGQERSLGDAEFAGKGVVLQLFGSWCPNCHDAAELMTEIYQTRKSDGLSVVGLAFELTDDFDRNKTQVERYVDRHGTTYPVLIVGPSDKRLATAAFGALDRVHSFPTTIFIKGDGTVHAIYTGFSGPATGDDYVRLKKTYERLINEILELESSE
ncbi:MAG: TlpA disulfide reductase family protein [Pirellulaceae bacterium]